MSKIRDDFNGYLAIGEDCFACFVRRNQVIVLPASSHGKERMVAVDRVRSRDTSTPEFLYGNDGNSRIALLRTGGFHTSVLGMDPTVRFGAPMIVKEAGNANGFFNMLTSEWNTFHAITFVGGNINSICNPQVAMVPQDETFHRDGSREIRVLPWDQYGREIAVEIDGEKATLTFSVSQAGDGHDHERMDVYSLGELNSLLRLTFDRPQPYDQIPRYYGIVRDLVALLTGQNNVTFDIYLSQKSRKGGLFTTAHCKAFDSYENYVKKSFLQTISLFSVFDQLPGLVEKLAKHEADPLLELLPEDNRKARLISITDVQNLCTALEVAYGWKKRPCQKDALVKELKDNIKETIDVFIRSHPEIDPYQEATLSSAFQYLDYTLREKILTLYQENSGLIDEISRKHRLPQVDQDTVAAFVKLRNRKAHSGTVDWGESAAIYQPLFVLVYGCFFRFVGVPDDLRDRFLTLVF